MSGIAEGIAQESDCFLSPTLKLLFVSRVQGGCLEMSIVCK
jgi:hypothetical protein